VHENNGTETEMRAEQVSYGVDPGNLFFFSFLFKGEHLLNNESQKKMLFDVPPPKKLVKIKLYK
jgi:hypothetical protein